MKITSIVGIAESEITERGVLSTEMIEKVWKLLSVHSPFIVFFILCNLFSGDGAPRLKIPFSGFCRSGQACQTKSKQNERTCF